MIHSSMAGDTAKRSLSPARRQLVELFQRLNFGRIEDLTVQSGEPVLDPMPRVVREHKFGGENGPRPEARLGDFTLKAQHLDLFRLLDDLGDGSITVLTVKHGLPFHAEVAG
ncbi:MAG: hypothetical protein JWO38_3017 [Gemmataceae bacterium]|nr:hypothetical protein [Gemmataceae bacterium]